MATHDYRSPPVSPTRDPHAGAPPVHFSYCPVADEAELWTEPPGEGEEDNLGQGLRIRRDGADGRILQLKLCNVREHLGAGPEDRVVVDPVPDLSGLEFDPKGKTRDVIARDLIRFVLEVTGLRVLRQANAGREL